MERKLTAGALIAIVGVAGPAIADDRVVNIYNWSDYIAGDTLERFEEETGIRVNYDVFDSNEVLEGQLLAGGSGYDVVVPTGSFLERQVAAGVFQPLDKSKLSNYGNLDEEILQRVASQDPDNAYAIPYMWGTNGFGYNVGMIEERMPDAPVDSLDMIFDPDVVSNFADCGVTVLDSPSEMFPMALHYLGYDPNNATPEQHEEAEALFMQIRPHIEYFHSSQYINDLANGDVCLSVGWSGDVLIAQDRAAEADRGVEIDYTIPVEGTLIWFDLMAIPDGAPNVDEAHEFLDFIMRPDVIADITNYVYYPNANAEATELVDEEIRDDPRIYPPQAVLDNLFPSEVQTPEIDRIRTRAWTRIKTGT